MYAYDHIGQERSDGERALITPYEGGRHKVLNRDEVVSDFASSIDSVA